MSYFYVNLTILPENNKLKLIELNKVYSSTHKAPKQYAPTLGDLLRRRLKADLA